MTTRLMLAAILLAAPVIAQAQGGGRGLMRADANGDGAISRAEATAQSDQRFAMMDTNKDGTLAADERTGPGARMLERADRNGDGKVTKAEYDALVTQRFMRMDANGDGTISTSELSAVLERVRGARGGADPADAIAPPPPATPPRK